MKGLKRLSADGPGWLAVPAAKLGNARMWIVAVLLAAFVLGPLEMDAAWLTVWTSIAVLALAGAALNLAFGYTGILDSGHAVYFGLGAYTAILTTSHLEVPSIVGVGLGMLLATALAGLLGVIVLRMQGFLQLLITVALASIAGALIVSFTFTGAEVGVSAGARDVFGTGDLDDVQVHLLAAGTTAVIVLMMEFLPATRLGRLLATVRAVPDVASTAGVPVFRTRVAVYMVAGAVSALAGGLSAISLLFASPTSIGLAQSIQILIVVVIGGTATSVGPLFGATIILILPQWFGGIADYQTLLIGLIFVTVLIRLRGGVATLVPTPVERPRDSSPGSDADASLEPIRERSGAELEIRDLRRHFGGVRAVDGVSLTVEPGRIHALVGPNGSGKSTIVNLVTGLLLPTKGSIRFRGRSIERMPSFKRTRLGMTRTFQLVALAPNLTLAENVMVGAFAARRSGLLRDAVVGPRNRWERDLRDRSERVMRAVGIGGFAHLRPDQTPPGIRRLTEVARCFVTGAGLMILDEPAAGLDSNEKTHLAGVLRAVAMSGRAILLVEHDMNLVMSLADHVTVVDEGKVLVEGSPEQVRRDAAVASAYFGRQGVATSATPPPDPGEAWVPK
ncbi:branched-chain amino acid ABC transporter ATP-binding protein/permease [Actinophytocola sp.]|uniref:branched-chain amino acid ABC transporter ATP-binding protein/permease n=1 Tax=Actinophytocola sp. TaxID=1872138 RepID=UPI003D6A01B7